jgi:hypothetical protein
MYILPELPKKKPKKAPHKKSDAIKELETLAFEEAKCKHPSIDPRYLAPRTFSDKGANSLTAAIVAYIRLKGGMASRINTTGVWDQRLNKYRISTQQRGLADIWGTYKSKSLQVEVKIGRDKQSEDQMKVQQQQIAAGGYYFLAHSFEEFKAWLDEL